MQTFDVQSIEIQAPFDEVFSYIANPSTLPEWTEAFASVNGHRARMRTPAGAAEVDLTVTASRDSGVIDWTMTFPDGQKATAWSRVVPQGPDRTIYSFVLPAPPVPLEQLEGTLATQSKQLASELATLARRLQQSAGVRSTASSR